VRTPLLLLCVLILAFSCKKDKIITDSGAKLEFSTDSILFDTVFTSIGSTTKQFKVYNNNKGAISVSSIKLAGGASSNFRINIDGVSAISMGNIEIPSHDSIFVFVEVTVDPNGVNSPLVISDEITFITNGNTQQVLLEAWGQDAYYHAPNIFSTNGFPPYSIFTCDEIWTNDKPHVIYGYAVVDSDCSLTMQAGTRVYLHKNAVLWVYQDGSLKINGTHMNEVTFQGDRLETEYKDVPGQWGKIWLSPLSKNNQINWAIIKDGSIGIQVDTFPNGTTPTLIMSNTKILNMSAACLYGQGSKIRANNCVFANAGQYTTALTIGGNYSFWHCTFANYWNGGTRQTPSILINNWYKDIYKVPHSRSLDSAYFGNCIIYGNLVNELALDSAFGASFNYKFDHCLIRTDQSTSNGYHYETVYVNSDPSFADVVKNDYKLNASSSAINKGKVSIGATYSTDLKGDSRTVDAAPDLGAYEK